MDANQRAAARSTAGMPRELEQPRDNNAPHPRQRGSSGYPLWHRLDVMNLVAQQGVQATAIQTGISRTSLIRWQQRIVPYRQTGGRDRDNLVGTDLLLLAFWLFVYPSSTADQTGTFIFNNSGGRLYSREAISQRMKEMKLTKKKGSMEAYQAFTTINQSIHACQCIDTDEAGFELGTVQSRTGHTPLRQLELPQKCYRQRHSGTASVSGSL